MRFYTGQHQHYCGIDLHARTLYLCVQDREGNILLHKNLPCDRARFLEAIEPFRDDLVVASECIFNWYWLADLCAEHHIPFVLGHALYMKAIHGAKAKNDKIDALKTTSLLRGGLLRKSVETDLALCDTYDGLIRDLENTVLRQARSHDFKTLLCLNSIPGIGKILSLTLLYEIHDIRRFPSVQDFASYARLVKCEKTSAGKRTGASGGSKIGNAHLKWAFSEAAITVLSHFPESQRLHNRLKRKFGKGKALSIFAHKLGRTVYFMLQRNQSFDPDRFLANA